MFTVNTRKVCGHILALFGEKKDRAILLFTGLALNSTQTSAVVC
jgi:hypothetical protein